MAKKSKTAKHKRMLDLKRRRKIVKIGKQAQAGDSAASSGVRRKDLDLGAMEAPPHERRGQGLGLFESDSPKEIRKDRVLIRRAKAEDWMPPARNVRLAHVAIGNILQKQADAKENADPVVTREAVRSMEVLADCSFEQMKADRPTVPSVQITNALPGSVVTSGNVVSVELTPEQKDALCALRYRALGVDDGEFVAELPGSTARRVDRAGQGDPGCDRGPAETG